MTNGTFIMIDGIAGSGKTTVIQAMFKELVARGLRCFRLQDWKETHPPRFEEIPDFDVYFTSEPTRQWIGAAIREEMSRVDQLYGGEELAHAFALDREIMYRRLIIPAKRAKKIIIQDRGFSTSLAYQVAMPGALSFEAIGSLPGNILALVHAPDALILTTIPVQMAISRISLRHDDNKGVFQDPVLLTKVADNFKSKNFRALFEESGTRIFDLDTSGTLEESKTSAVSLITQLLKNT